MSAEHSETGLAENADPGAPTPSSQDVSEPEAPLAGPGSEAAEQDELTLDELEQHIAEAEQLHRDLTARLDATAQD